MPLPNSCASQSAVVVQLAVPKQAARQVMPNSTVFPQNVATLPLPQDLAAGKQPGPPSPVSTPQHVPSQQMPLLQSSVLSHLWRAASATFGVKASVPPTRAAPNSLSALPRDKVPLESPTASSSKELAPVPWPSATPFTKGGTRQPRQLANAPTLARGDKFSMNSWPTSENPQKAKFVITAFYEVRPEEQPPSILASPPSLR